MVKYANNSIREKPDIFIKDLLEDVKGKFPEITISHQHLGRILRNENKTMKCLRHIHQPATYWGKSRDHEKEITKYLRIIRKQPIDKIIALDETGIYAYLKGSYRRCDLGRRCIYKTTDNKVFKKYSLLVAINTNGIIGCKLYEEGSVNSECLTEFVRENITSKFEENIVIMDNTIFHKTHNVKKKYKKGIIFYIQYPIIHDQIQ